MKSLLLVPVLLATVASSHAFTPAEDPYFVGNIRNEFKKGTVLKMEDLRGIYFDCKTFSARAGTATNGFFGFGIEFFGPVATLNTQLPLHHLSGMGLATTKTEVFGRVNTGYDDPVEHLSLREGAPITIEKPAIDQNYLPTKTEFIKAIPIYMELSIQDGPSMKYTVKPISPSARSSSMGFGVKEYGICVTSKYHSRLNNSGLGLASNTRSAWDGVSSVVWRAHRGPVVAY